MWTTIFEECNFFAGFGASGPDIFVNNSRLNSIFYGFNGNDLLKGGGGFNLLKGSAGDDRIVGGLGGYNDLTGNGGNDTIISQRGSKNILRVDAFDTVLAQTTDTIVGIIDQYFRALHPGNKRVW